jgi:Ca-activated chloride channel family protein
VSGPTLARPELLGPLAAGLGLAALALLLARRRAGRRARALLSTRAPRPAGLAGDLLLLVALLAVAAAGLGPRLGSRVRLVPAAGVDVVFLLDVSPSMLARDVPPSRLDRAREAARRVLAELLPGDRAALAVFSGRGVLLTPLTPDLAALAEWLPALDPGLMQEQGSRLAEGLEAVLAAFEPASPRPRALFVLGDGEDPERAPLPSAGLRRAGVRVVAALFGDEAGARVPKHDGWLRDARGREVISRREAAPLGSLAAGSDGLLLLADRWGRIDVAQAVAALRREAGAGPGGLALRREPRELVGAFAAAAFLLLLLELAGSGRGRPAPAPVAALAIALAAASAGAEAPARAELEAQVRRDPEDARALIALGVARARAGELDEAARALFAAAARAREPRLAAHAYYDLAVVELERGRLESARNAFFDALALAPDDLEARFNLEWTLRRLRSRPPAPAPPPAEPAGPARETAEPRPEERAQPEARAESHAAAGGEPSEPQEVPDLDAEQAQRWLARVPDDPSPSLRDAVRRAGAGRPRPPRAAPRW